MRFSPGFIYARGNDVYTKLLLHCDGADASTTFTDSSASAFSVTAVGNAQIDTAQSVYGGASGLFDGTGDYLTVSDDAALRPGAGDFTYDFWCRPKVGSAFQGVLNKGALAAGGLLVQYNNSASPALTVYASGSLVLTESSGVTAGGSFFHYELSRSGGTIKLFRDGVQMATASNSTNFNSTAALEIGRQASAYLNGHIDEFRFSAGIARHTAAFTPPTSAYS